jgi:hypothetical protein
MRSLARLFFLALGITTVLTLTHSALSWWLGGPGSDSLGTALSELSSAMDEGNALDARTEVTLNKLLLKEETAEKLLGGRMKLADAVVIFREIQDDNDLQAEGVTDPDLAAGLNALRWTSMAAPDETPDSSPALRRLEGEFRALFPDHRPGPRAPQMLH